MMIKFKLYLLHAKWVNKFTEVFVQLEINMIFIINFGNKSKCRYFHIQFHVFCHTNQVLRITLKTRSLPHQPLHNSIIYLNFKLYSHLRFLQVRFTYRIKFIARSHEGSLSWELYKDLWRRRRVYKDLWKCIAYRRIVDIIVTVTTKPAVMKLVSWWQVTFIAI